MRHKVYILSLLIISVVATPALTVRAESVSEREYKLKAAFLYNFVVFVDGARFDQLSGHSEDTLDPNAPIVIGVIGESPFGDAFAPLKNKAIRNRSVVVRQFKGYSEIVDPNDPEIPSHPQFDRIQECHVLFVCPSEKDYMDHLIKSIGTRAILTVADTPGFLEAGGMINFVIHEKKVRFEINQAATTRAKLRIRSKLLRLARRVVERDLLSQRDQKEDEAENDTR